MGCSPLDESAVVENLDAVRRRPALCTLCVFTGASLCLCLCNGQVRRMFTMKESTAHDLNRLLF